MERTIAEYDVLVIGGSGAAVTSAVSAAKNGASRVAMVCKGKVGRSGNSIMIGGSLSVDGASARDLMHKDDANLNYTKEKLFQKTVASSFFIGDQAAQMQFINDGPAGIRMLMDWAEENNEIFAFNPQGCRWRTSGKTLGRSLEYGMKKDGSSVDIFEDTMIAELLTNDGKVCGALGLNVYTGEIVEFRAKAVVLATGGFQPFSLKCSISDMTGDGIAMALRAGAVLRDMEFLLFIPILEQPTKYKGSILPFQMTMQNIFPMQFKLTDLDGDVIPYPTDDKYYVAPANMKVYKLLMCYFYGIGMMKKWDKYEHRFYYDYSEFTDQQIRDAFAYFAKFQSNWYSDNRYHHIRLLDLAEDIIRNNKRLMVGFGNEYSMGGVCVDSKFATSVDGLFAAGEVTGGLFGAFRAGDGVVEMLSNGMVAGESAAIYAKSAEQLVPTDTESKVKEIEAPLHCKDGHSAAELHKELEKICDRGFNFFRDGAHLEEAEKLMTELMGKLDRLSAGDERKYNLEWINAITLKNLAVCCLTGIHCASDRKESRGCHLRSDYPEVDNKNYLFSYSVKLNENGQLEYGKIIPEALYTPLPEKNFENVGEFIAETILGGMK